MSFTSTKEKNPPNLTKDTFKSFLNRSHFDCNTEFHRPIYKGASVSTEDENCFSPPPCFRMRNIPTAVSILFIIFFFRLPPQARLPIL